MLALGMKVKINPDVELLDIEDDPELLEYQEQGAIGIIRVIGTETDYPIIANFYGNPHDFAEDELIVL